jgi:hypothetical protein
LGSDRLSLAERADRIIELVNRWRPQANIYERYGAQAHEEYIRKVMHERHARCPIKPVGGSLSKIDRIKRLMPLFEQARIVLLPYCNRTLYDGTTTDLVQDFTEQEYTAFPVSQHDDMLDALSRICDEKELGLRWPQGPTSMGGGGRPSLPKSYVTGTSGGQSFWERQRSKNKGYGSPDTTPQSQATGNGYLGEAGVEVMPRIVLQLRTSNALRRRLMLRQLLRYLQQNSSAGRMRIITRRGR